MKKLSKEILILLEENMADASEGPKYSEVWADPLLANFQVAQEDHYGGEGKGDEYWTVFKLTDKETKDDYFVEFNGYYASYQGNTWEDVRQVKPIEVKKRDWEEVK